MKKNWTCFLCTCLQSKFLRCVSMTVVEFCFEEIASR